MDTSQWRQLVLATVSHITQFRVIHLSQCECSAYGNIKSYSYFLGMLCLGRSIAESQADIFVTKRENTVASVSVASFGRASKEQNHKMGAGKNKLSSHSMW